MRNWPDKYSGNRIGRVIMRLAISGIKLRSSIPQTIDNIKKKIKDLTGLSNNDYSDFVLIKKSIDARKKPEIFYIYQVAISVNDNKKAVKLQNNKKIDVKEYNPVVYSFPVVEGMLGDVTDRPVVVGFGPAGMICALYLARIGLRPIVIERGEPVEQRINSVEEFWAKGKLKPNSNIQFGEGGAGTFSDGKLQTGVKDKTGRISEILKTFVQYGAPEEIVYLSKPHIGTDNLVTMVVNIRHEIERLGGEIRFNTHFVRPLHNNFTLTGGLFEATCDDGELGEASANDKSYVINTKALILAIGHSARDTFRELLDAKVLMTSKPFAVGFRVQHSQQTINESQYGEGYDSSLPAADYKLTYTAKSGRGVYSFCMCPGGYVVNASSQPGKLAVNGMSYHDRAGNNANSAIIITIDSDTYGDNVLDGMYFQEKLEQRAYEAGQGKIPLQTLGDFKADIAVTNPDKVRPAIKGQYVIASNRQILPEELNQDFIEAFDRYGQIIKGFDNDSTLICGVESRTSSPVKIIRNDDYMSNISGLYPCGEGAGYAGGITSAALDGLKVAEKVALMYN